MSFDSERMKSLAAYRLHKALLVYVTPMVLIFGLAGNALSLAVLLRPAMRQRSTYAYLAVLSVADTVVLLLGAARTWHGQLTDSDVRDGSEFACKFIQMIGYTFSDYAVWLLVAVTMERYVIVMWPLRASAVCVRSRALGLCACLFLVLLAVNSHFAWTVGLHTELGDAMAGDNSTVPATVTSVTACSNTPDHFIFITQVWPWLDAALYSLLPFIVLSQLNIQIVLRLWSARRLRRKYLVEGSATGRHGNDALIGLRESAVPSAVTTEAHWRDSCNGVQEQCWESTATPLSRHAVTAIGNSSSMTAITSLTACRQQGGQGHGHHGREVGVGRQLKYKRHDSQDSELRLTTMLLTVTFTFLVCTLPTTVAYVVTAFYEQRLKGGGGGGGGGGGEMDAEQMVANFDLTSAVTKLLMFINHSINFYLYCATGHKFCCELRRLFRSCCARRQRRHHRAND